MRRSSSLRRPALFDESPNANGKEVPGALHLASEDHLRQTVRKHGAINLVRQLAEDLAERDTEITALRRLTEERERELRKMLREAEISKPVIDERLRRVDERVESATTLQHTRPRTNHTNAGGLLISTANGIGLDEMMGEAMRENVGTITESEEEGGSLLPSPHASRMSSCTTLPSQTQDIGTRRGWKNYFFNGDAFETTFRPSGAARRKGLDEDLFNPIRRTSTTPHSQDRTRDPSVQSRKSSNSVTSWTLKLFGGNQGAGQSTIRGRSSTTGSQPDKQDLTTTTPSKDSSHARAALMHVSSKDAIARTVKKRVPPLPPLPSSSGTVRKQGVSVPVLTSPKAAGNSGNLGPVEMETILPPESRPPTDQLYNLANPTDHLVDRYGFIYDGRRQTREAQAVTTGRGKPATKKPTSSVKSGRRESVHTLSDVTSSHSRTSSLSQTVAPTPPEESSETPPKRWQDYLKIAIYPTELLSHTPVAQPLTTVVNSHSPHAAKQSPLFNDVRGLPTTSLNLEPAASPNPAKHEAASKGEIGPVEQPLSISEMEPVKLLLKQLTEIHDSLQRDRAVKWNEFLRKVRAEWQKEGETNANPNDDRPKISSATPEAALIDGSLIGISNFGNKGKVGRAKWKEFKTLVLAGIPVAYRAKIWSECSGASTMHAPEYYNDLLNLPATDDITKQNSADDPSILAQIEMDIHRTMTDNVFFRAPGPGVQKLKDVLLAYSRRNADVGYCQGMNLIAASLLLIMPTPEAAFWMLCAVIEQILPAGYFAPPLLASRADSVVLRGYVKDVLPALSSHLEDLSIDLEALTFQWFLSLFTDCLSAEALFRIWDVVFCTCSTEGSTFLFQVALALLKLNEKELLRCQAPGDVYWYLGNKVTDHAVGIDGLVSASEALGKLVRRAEVEERRRDAIQELKQQMNGRGSGSAPGSEADLKIQEPRPVEE